MAIDLLDIPLKDLAQAQQTALIRLHLYTMAEIHGVMLEVSKSVRDVFQGRDGSAEFSSADAGSVSNAVLSAWDAGQDRLTEIIGHGIRHAAMLPFGQMAVMHDALLLPIINEAQATPTAEARSINHTYAEARSIASDNLGQTFDDILYQTVNRTYSDDLAVSDRLWRMDANARRGIRRTVAAGVAEQKSNWEVAQDLEGYLGAGAECPRWTRSRLQVTKADIAAGDDTGRITGGDCKGQGVSYNALRLARTEMQFAAHAMTRELFDAMPWVDAERFWLSPDHPEVDECDDWESGGPNGDGIYPLGEIILPLHPNCLCFTEGIIISVEELIGRYQDYAVSGGGGFGRYASMLGGVLGTALTGFAISNVMGHWLNDDPNQLDDVFYASQDILADEEYRYELYD
ncbi:MAG: hypothetical protein PVH03_04660 [Chloroflexota bacterium]